MSSLQNKLNNYEVVPPSSAWDKIAAALDEDNTTGQQYPSKLYNLEMAPPAAAWSNINSSLDSVEPKVVPMRKTASGFYRYAVAVAVIGIAALGIIKWIAGTNHSTSAGVAKTAGFKDSGTAEKINTPATVQPRQEESSSPEKEPPMLAQVDVPVKPRLHKTTNAGISSANYNYDETGDVSSNPIYAYEDHVPDLADRYIMLMTPEGKFIRMSKKWGSLVCCVSGQEQDADCKDQLKKWQQKIAASTLAPSPGNFMDILSLVNSLDDNAGL